MTRLAMADSAGNSGKLTLDRAGRLTIQINQQPPVVHALGQNAN